MDGLSEPEPTPTTEPDLVGYPSVEALADAKRASDREAKRLYTELQAREAELTSAWETIAGLAVAPGARSISEARDDPEHPRAPIPDRRQDANGNGNGNGVSVDDEARRVLRERHQAANRAGRDARRDWPRIERELDRMLGDDDLATRYVQALHVDPMQAAGIVAAAWDRAAALRYPVEQALRRSASHAAIPGAMAGWGRNAPQPTRESVARAAMEANPTRANRERWAEARIGASLPESHRPKDET